MNDNVYVIDTNSWHYRFNVYICDIAVPSSNAHRYIQNKNNFCAYWRVFAISVLLTIIMCFVAAFVVSCAVFLVFMVGLVFYLEPLKALMILALVATILGIFYRNKIKNAINKKIYGDKYQPVETTKREPGFLMTKYLSWKHKYCPAVEFKTHRGDM